jgi:hypothetical protein
MSKQRHPCGCISDDRQWLFMCEPDATEFRERHERAQREHAGIPDADEYAWLDAPQPAAIPDSG